MSFQAELRMRPYRYATLYRNPDGTLQTSLKVHIEAVRRPGVREIVRLAKLWRARRGLSWSTFALEITVIRALAGRPIADYADAVIKLWQFMVAEMRTIRLVDPANTSNVIELSAADRHLPHRRQAHHWRHPLGVRFYGDGNTRQRLLIPPHPHWQRSAVH
jgi:hypothetical protein